MSAVAHLRRDKTDRAVEVLTVVPIGEELYPSLRVSPCGKAFGRLVWAVLAGAKQCLGEWVVVADEGTTVGRNDAQLFQRHLHQAAVVGVQHQRE